MSNLPASLSPDALRSLLTPFGRLQSIRIPRFRGATFITYDTPAEAQQARKVLNGRVVAGKSILTGTAVSILPPETANIFLKNVPMHFTPAMMEDLFDKELLVLSSTIAVDEENQSRGYGYVQFYSEEMATRAIVTTNGRVVEGQTITAERFLKKTHRGGSTGFTLYVKGFPSEVREEQLKLYFAPFGVVDAVAIKGGAGGRVGFVTYANRLSAETAIAKLHGQVADGITWFCSAQLTRELRGEYLQHREQVWKDRNLIITRLPKGCSERTLEAALSRFGHVVSSHIKREDVLKEGNTDEETGYVCFETAEEAEAAIRLGKTVEIKGRRVCIEKWRPKHERLPGYLPFDPSAYERLSPSRSRPDYLENYLHHTLNLLSSLHWANRLIPEFTQLDEATLLSLASDLSALKAKARQIAEKMRREDRERASREGK